jgi:geranylgeranyl diphosphate synthase type II
LNFNTALQEILDALNGLRWKSEPAHLYDPIAYILSIGGKRMRPALALMGCHLFGKDYHLALQPSLVVEVFHNFTLMHDDIMDKAPLRRGKPTVHEKWDTNVAILSGDAMLVEAYELLLNSVPAEKLPAIMKRFNRCALDVCEGQQEDMDFETMTAVSKEAYIEMIKKKTAVLLGFSLELGALLAGASETQSALLRDFGVNLGIAFQLRDDILDVYGDPEKFGKQIGGDILSNKKTFLLLHALERASGTDAEALQYWLHAKDFVPSEKVSAVTGIYNTLLVRQEAEQKAEAFFQLSLQQLQAIEAEESLKTPLKQFAFMLMERQS